MRVQAACSPVDLTRRGEAHGATCEPAGAGAYDGHEEGCHRGGGSPAPSHCHPSQARPGCSLAPQDRVVATAGCRRPKWGRRGLPDSGSDGGGSAERTESKCARAVIRASKTRCVLLCPQGKKLARDARVQRGPRRGREEERRRLGKRRGGRVLGPRRILPSHRQKDVQARHGSKHDAAGTHAGSVDLGEASEGPRVRKGSCCRGGSGGSAGSRGGGASRRASGEATAPRALCRSIDRPPLRRCRSLQLCALRGVLCDGSSGGAGWRHKAAGSREEVAEQGWGRQGGVNAERGCGGDLIRSAFTPRSLRRLPPLLMPQLCD